MLITRSLWLKALVTIVAAGGFISLYEVTMRDSKRPDPKAPPAPGDRISISATAYCKGNVTAAGVAAQNGAAASDRNLLPLGSIVQLETGDPRYDGMYTILDTGPEIKGREVDIYMWSCNDALQFGRRAAHLTLLRQGWNPRATPPPAPSFVDRLLGRQAPAPPPEAVTSRPLPSRPLPRPRPDAPQSETPQVDTPKVDTPPAVTPPAEIPPATAPQPATAARPATP